MKMLKPEIDLEWKPPHLRELSPHEKAKNTRARKKHFKLIDRIRNEILQEHFINHTDHKHKAVDTRYLDDVFQREDVYCDCGLVLEITKEMFESKYGREYKLSLSSI